jgi:hypothetical protein
MYFPYFRGRQYELLALRELVKNKLINNSIIPVVEPVKLTSTLDNVLKIFQEAQIPIGLVFNPSVGDLANNSNMIDSLYQFLQLSSIVPSILINEETGSCLQALAEHRISKNMLLAVLDRRDNLDVYNREFSSNYPRFTLITEERQIRRSVSENKVLFEDKFVKRPKNADYPEDEFFSEDHLYFRDEGYSGFGDYSIVGKDYFEGGWAPYAVVIHIVYFDNEQNLRIKHFISDSNDDTSDIAGKFYEAVSKLEKWFSHAQNCHLTIGLRTYLEHFENHTYPGLPTLKKLSIMHHLELVGNFLDQELT